MDLIPGVDGFFHQIDVLSGAIQISPAISFYLVRSRGDLAYSRAVFLFFFALRAHRRFPPAPYMGRSRSRSLSSSSSSSEDSAEREERMQRERDDREERELKREQKKAAKKAARVQTAATAKAALLQWRFLIKQDDPIDEDTFDVTLLASCPPELRVDSIVTAEDWGRLEPYLRESFEIPTSVKIGP